MLHCNNTPFVSAKPMRDAYAEGEPLVSHVALADVPCGESDESLVAGQSCSKDGDSVGPVADPLLSHGQLAVAEQPGDGAYGLPPVAVTPLATVESGPDHRTTMTRASKARPSRGRRTGGVRSTARRRTPGQGTDGVARPPRSWRSGRQDRSTPIGMHHSA